MVHRKIKKKTWRWNVFEKGRRYELQFAYELEKSGFKILFKHDKGWGNYDTPYDIIARNKKTEKIYFIEVKTSFRKRIGMKSKKSIPKYDLHKDSFRQMLSMKKVKIPHGEYEGKTFSIDTYGLCFHLDGRFYLFTINKQSIAGKLAWGRARKSGRTMWGKGVRIYRKN